ncbi:MAG: hypothetical protein ACRC8P_00050 [Spiroplasma sp.]
MFFKLNIIYNNFSLFNGKTAIYLIIVFSFIILSFILINVFWRWVRKDKYKGSRFTTKNIAYITMLTSVSVVATIVVSVTIPITVLPPVRLAIEGLMVKIAGYMFGPVIGIISATITDILVMLFVPSYINPVYIFCIVLTGFVSGIAGVLKIKLKNYPWVIFLLINLFMIFFAAGGAFLTLQYPQENISLSAGVTMNKYAVAGIIVGGGLFTLLIIYIALFFYWKNGEKKKIHDILPIILLAVFAEYVITVLIGSYADMNFLSPSSSKDYGLTMIPRIVMAPVKIIINSIIIYITWKTVNPLITIDNLN